MKSIQNLPQKQQGEFKGIIKMLDNKDYKKGLKHIQKLHLILPEQAEVLSLKAIFLYYNEQQTEGQVLAKQALFKNLKSDFCWHIYGLIHKAMKNYPEAVKCFNQALKYDNDNLQLLRDLANLQLHIRDYEGHAETRRSILLNKTNMTTNWIAFVVANNLNGENHAALDALTSTIKVIQNDSSNKMKSVEENELTLYNVTLLIEMNKLSDALKLIHQSKQKITDRISLNMFLYQIYEKMGNRQEAIKHVELLVELQPQNWNYYRYLLNVHNLDEKNMDHYKQIYDVIAGTFKVADNNLLKGRQLGFCDVSQFKQLFIEYITPYFEKALPSLFREIVHLYQQPLKIPLMEESYRELLKGSHPMCPLWAMMLLAQHLNHIQEQESALEWVEKAITHTPTLHELYLVKAKILKKQCRFVEAAEVVDYARRMDLADRYLNNKAIKYALNANLIYQGQDLIRLFLKDSNESNPHDIQTIWYECGMGRAYMRLKYYGPAFRMFTFIEKHFEEMYEDQIDFYSFSMRKYSIRSLKEMIQYHDNVHNNRYFITAATEMIKGLISYIGVVNAKKQAKEEEEGQKKKLSINEKKKIQKQKQKEDEEKQIRNQFTIEGHIFTQEHRLKLDLSGDKLISTLTDSKVIIQDAQRLAKHLINITDNKYQKQAFNAFKVLSEFYIMTDRPTLALKCLKNLQKDKQVISHKYQLKLLNYLQNFKDKKLDPVVAQVIEEELSLILEGQSISEYNLKFFQSNNLNTLLDQAIGLECSSINTPMDNKELIKLLESKNASPLDVYTFLQEFPQLLSEDCVKMFLQQNIPQLNVFYYDDPNLTWQNKQIEDKKNEIKLQQ